MTDFNASDGKPAHYKVAQGGWVNLGKGSVPALPGAGWVNLGKGGVSALPGQGG